MTCGARHLYVHLPFCAHRCGYCDFVTTTGREHQHGAYVDALLRELGRDIDVVFELQVPRDVLLERMQKRAAEENRSDDTPDAIRQRLEIYQRETAPLVEYYRTTRGNVVGIRGDRAIDEIFAEIRAALDQVAA